MSDSQLAKIREGEVPAALDAPERALCRYVFALTALKGVPAVVLKEMQSHSSSRQIVDVALVSADYMAAGALIIGLGVETEPADVLQTELDWQRTTLAGEGGTI